MRTSECDSDGLSEFMAMDFETDNESHEEIVIGDLKWFKPELGYGFIVDRKTGSDILLGRDILAGYGWATIAEGSRLEAKIVRTTAGVQVAKIINIAAPSDLEDCNVFDFDALDYLSDEFVQAKVVWYDKEKGYGFANTHGDQEGCFIHWTALQEAGLLSVIGGQTIAIRVGRGENGRVAASIRSCHAPSAKAGAKVDASAGVPA